MDAILNALNSWRQSFDMTPAMSAALIGGLWVLVQMAVSRDDLLADVRSVLRHLDISEKQFAGMRGISQPLISHKIHGTNTKTVTLDDLAALPEEALQWVAVKWAARFGVPQDVIAGARLARRHARMSITAATQKKESA